MIQVNNYLIVSILGSNRADLISEFSRTCAQCGCNLLKINLNVLGNELSAVFFLSGNWGAIVKMEAAMPSLEQRLNITTLIERTTDPIIVGQWMLYNLQLVAIDQPGILHGLSDFLLKSDIVIEEIRYERD